ncbi:DegV family protein [Lacrimispora saccharolytica]|uniref:DegV family protein n=1 Tax=Lacrimispora saccharolytica TaxID=84030 RepID=UPI00265CB500|nr:DegV family protein [Lacrimispora saccharolytica]MCF2656233.1 DegV family protein [Lacrimispora saccharolytica]
MSKVRIITDSNSGITVEDARELGVTVLPMPFSINEEVYFEQESLTHEQFYEELAAGKDIMTTQPSPAQVMGIWDEALKDYDEIVYIPMSSGLSGSYQTAAMLAEDYEGKVHVVNNQRISVTQRQSVLDALRLLEAGKSAKEIKDILEEDKFNSSIYLMVDTLVYLKKGGRITPAAAALGTLLKLKPVLQIQGERLDAFAKARTLSQAKSIIINAVKSDIDKRFGGLSKENISLHMAYAHDLDRILEFKEEVLKEFPGYDINLYPLSLSVATHIGPGCIALAVTKNLKV